MKEKVVKQRKTTKVSPRDTMRIKKAQVDYKRMWMEIKPFIKERKVRRYSTAGEWKAMTS